MNIEIKDKEKDWENYHEEDDDWEVYDENDGDFEDF